MARVGLPRAVGRRAKTLLGAIWSVASAAGGTALAFIEKQPAWVVAGIAVGLVILLALVARDQQRVIEEQQTDEEAVARRREIRDRLASLRREADLIIQPMRSYRERFYAGEGPPSLVVTWADNFSAWRLKVRNYLLATPELGPAVRHEFESLDGLPEPRMGQLHLTQQVEATIESIHVYQARLKEFMAEFKG